MAEGWGRFKQERAGHAQQAAIEVKWGKVRLKTIALASLLENEPRSVIVFLAGKPLPCRHESHEGKVRIALESETLLQAGDCLEVLIR